MTDSTLSDKNYADIGFDVAEYAYSIFCDCGQPDDFCHQHGVIFGGWNRIKLTKYGWVALRSSCTSDFLEAFDKLMKDDSDG